MTLEYIFISTEVIVTNEILAGVKSQLLPFANLPRGDDVDAITGTTDGFAGIICRDGEHCSKPPTTKFITYMVWCFYLNIILRWLLLWPSNKTYKT